MAGSVKIQSFVCEDTLSSERIRSVLCEATLREKIIIFDTKASAIKIY